VCRLLHGQSQRVHHTNYESEELAVVLSLADAERVAKFPVSH
jgi:hypothetical protein